MSRTAEDWRRYSRSAIDVRERLLEAVEQSEGLMSDTRFTEQAETMRYAIDEIEGAIANLNTVIGSVTGGWWDED